MDSKAKPERKQMEIIGYSGSYEVTMAGATIQPPVVHVYRVKDAANNVYDAETPLRLGPTLADLIGKKVVVVPKTYPPGEYVIVEVS